MASEIRVDKINSLSGVGTVTLSPTGVDIAGITTVATFKVGTGVTVSSDGDVFFTGIATATTFSGSGANLTALPSAQLSGALPAISALNLTNVPAANVVGVHTSLNITGSTTTGSAVVGGGVTISESGIEASGIGITCANINGTQIGGRRNIIINGAMQISQRGTSSTSTGYQTVDRFITYTNGVDEAPSFAKVNVSSGTSPYTEGFRSAFKITNGNQTGGAGGADYIILRQKIEAQNVAKSGWNYTSSSSFVTLSFWVKASVAQNYYFSLLSSDGTLQNFPMETGSLTADTWTKITKTIPGASGVQFNNDTGIGIELDWWPFAGTDYTASGVALNTWAAFASGTRFPDHTSTWYTTNDATFEITGVQLEVGPQATPFEHLSFAEELKLCHRYFYKTNRWMGGARGSGTSRSFHLDFGMRLTGSDVSSGTYTNDGTAGGDVVYIGSSATRQASDVTANSMGASSSSNTNHLSLGVNVGYNIGSGDNGIITGLYIGGFSIDHEL